MAELVAIIILIVSLSGMGIIIYRKAPLLLEPLEITPIQFNWKEQLVKIKNLPLLKDFSFEILLQKILSKIRILTLKTDSKTSSWLQRLRERSKKKKLEEREEVDNYWEKIKNSTKK